jgi:hypothetical protein
MSRALGVFFHRPEFHRPEFHRPEVRLELELCHDRGHDRPEFGSEQNRTIRNLVSGSLVGFPTTIFPNHYKERWNNPPRDRDHGNRGDRER